MRSLLLFIVFVLFLSGYSSAQDNSIRNESVENEPAVSADAVVNAAAANAEIEEAIGPERVIVGNKVCPVDSRMIPAGRQGEYEYKHKVYNFCSLMCIEEFQKDPEKYLKTWPETEKAAASSAAVKPAAAGAR